MLSRKIGLTRIYATQNFLSNLQRGLDEKKI
jgi:hypothetical protein